MSTTPPWTRLPCDECGVEHQATRTNPRQGPFVCSDCKTHKAAYRQGEAAGREAERAAVRQEAASIRAALAHELSELGCRAEATDASGDYDDAACLAAVVVAELEPLLDRLDALAARGADGRKDGGT